MTRFKWLLRFLGSLTGGGLAVAAAFAYSFGLDTNPDWGPSRKLMLLVGLVIIVAAWLGPVTSRVGRSRGWRVFRSWLLRVGRWIESPLATAGRGLRSSRAYEQTAGMARNLQLRLARQSFVRNLGSNPDRLARAFVLAFWGLGVAYLLWVATAGTWVRWPSTTSDFDLLARGFLHGHLYLPLQPSDRFLALSDPYGIEAQKYMPPVWDISYFKSHFYLYWGPVPAILTSAFRLVLGRAISDGWLTLVFVAGTALAGAWLLLSLRQELFPELPRWVVLPGALLLVGAAPPLWLMSRPAVYEAAISAGQFFLILGFLGLWPVLVGRSVSLLRLVVGGVCLALAFGGRLNLAPASAFLALVVLLALLAHEEWDWRQAGTRLASLLSPLALGSALLGLYNWARFGSILETGHKYQLTGVGGLHELSTSFVLGNIIPNLFNYLLQGFDWLTVFPYLKPKWGAYYIWPAHYYAPKGYYSEQVTGILLSVPFIWLAAAPLIRALQARLAKINVKPGPRQMGRRPKGMGWLVTAVAGTTFFLSLPLLLYSVASMRYEFDVLPMAIILASLGFWSWYRAGVPKGRLRWTVSACAVGLALVSLVAGFLLAMTGFASNFEKSNPQLFHTLTDLLTR